MGLSRPGLTSLKSARNRPHYLSASRDQRRNRPKPVRPETQPRLPAAKLRVGIPRHNPMSGDMTDPPSTINLPPEGLSRSSMPRTTWQDRSAGSRRTRGGSRPRNAPRPSCRVDRILSPRQAATSADVSRRSDDPEYQRHARPVASSVEEIGLGLLPRKAEKMASNAGARAADSSSSGQNECGATPDR
jgi:hypothetical protein